MWGYTSVQLHSLDWWQEWVTGLLNFALALLKTRQLSDPVSLMSSVRVGPWWSNLLFWSHSNLMSFFCSVNGDMDISGYCTCSNQMMLLLTYSRLEFLIVRSSRKKTEKYALSNCPADLHIFKELCSVAQLFTRVRVRRSGTRSETTGHGKHIVLTWATVQVNLTFDTCLIDMQSCVTSGSGTGSVQERLV